MEILCDGRVEWCDKFLLGVLLTLGLVTILTRVSVLIRLKKHIFSLKIPKSVFIRYSYILTQPLIAFSDTILTYPKTSRQRRLVAQQNQYYWSNFSTTESVLIPTVVTSNDTAGNNTFTRQEQDIFVGSTLSAVASQLPSSKLFINTIVKANLGTVSFWKHDYPLW